MNNDFQVYHFIVPLSAFGERLDVVISQHVDHLSRSRIQKLIKEKQVQIVVGGQAMTPASSSYRVPSQAEITVHVPPPVTATPQAQAIDIDVIYEDDDVIVVNKPAGLVVHPAVGNPDRTLVNALLAYCGDRLSGIGGVQRPGIVHRLDKDTSGLMVVAKNDQAHQGLAAQFKDRTLKRFYWAFVWGMVQPAQGKWEGSIGRHPIHRQKMAVIKNGRVALTYYHVEKLWPMLASQLECHLATGRTHQIRVHAHDAGYSLIGDPVYGHKPRAWQQIAKQIDKEGNPDQQIAWSYIDTFPRQALHAYKIIFIHPVNHQELSFTAPLPPDLEDLKSFLDKIILKKY